jgi:probable rRNA maturation factor
VHAALDKEAELTLRFVDAREGRRLNRDFRRQDHATNVLTFVYRSAPRIHADIVICVPIVRREARSQAKAFRDHLAHLLVHAVLHAQGHDHRTAGQARAMERRETALLAGLGIGDPY